MRRPLRFRLLAAVLGLLVACGVPAVAAQEANAYSQDELDQLLAPIALYPDDLLTQILVASTYPLEVVEAARFVRANPSLEGVALDDAVLPHNWDASVQSLTAFPQVLAMMDDKLEWTERLGDAFLADESRVMDTVQELRKRAEAAGNLRTTAQQTVVDDGGAIVVAPAEPEVIYVPVYDPRVIYGPWWAPGYLPWFWYPPPVYGYPAAVAGIAFGIGWTIGPGHWGWCRPDWGRHRVNVYPDHNPFWNRPNRRPPVPGQPWQHSPYHRRGVPYADVATRERYQPVNPGAVRDRRNYRGYAAPASPRGTTPAVPRTPATPPARVAPSPRTLVTPLPPPSRGGPTIFDPGMSRGQAQVHEQRGMQSLGQVPARAAPAVRAPSAPASAPAPARAPAPPSRAR